MTSEEIRVWRETVLEPVLRGEPVDEIEASQAGGLALLSADADKIKEYVFESAKLPEIRGASMILDELNWGEEPVIEDSVPRNLAGVWEKYSLPIEARIYAGGGSLLALVPHDLAEELKREIEALYPRETGAATITCVWRKVAPSELQGGYQPEGLDYTALLALRDSLSEAEWQRIADYYHECSENGSEITPEQFARRRNFGQLMALQSIELRKAKEQKAMSPLFESVPFARRCQSCGIRPANQFDPIPSPGRYLCQVCHKKAGIGEETVEGKPSERRARKSHWNREFAERYGVVAEAPSDLERIGQPARGYIGFIYADGNEVGAAVEASTSLSMYRKRSELLSEVMRFAVYEAIYRHLAAVGYDRTFEIITIGGDDALLIVPGNAALLLAAEMCQLFECRLVEAGFTVTADRRATMSAGVVIADHHNPLYFLRGLAEELLRSAKKRAWELVADPDKTAQGTVDFMVLKSQSTVATTVGHLRGAPPYRFTDRLNRMVTILTQRPFTLEEMDQLVNTVQGLKMFGFPGSQLQGLRAMLYRGRMRATLYYLYQYARANKERRKLLAWIEKQWGMRNARNPPPWVHLGRKRGFDRYTTPWPDIIEVLEFIPKPSDEKKRWLREQILGEGGEVIASRD